MLSEIYFSIPEGQDYFKYKLKNGLRFFVGSNCSHNYLAGTGNYIKNLYLATNCKKT